MGGRNLKKNRKHVVGGRMVFWGRAVSGGGGEGGGLGNWGWGGRESEGDVWRGGGPSPVWGSGVAGVQDNSIWAWS